MGEEGREGEGGEEGERRGRKERKGGELRGRGSGEGGEEQHFVSFHFSKQATYSSCSAFNKLSGQHVAVLCRNHSIAYFNSIAAFEAPYH